MYNKYMWDTKSHNLVVADSCLFVHVQLLEYFWYLMVNAEKIWVNELATPLQPQDKVMKKAILKPYSITMHESFTQK